MNMELENLHLRRKPWVDGSPVCGEIKFSSPEGTIELNLTPQNCQDILAVVASRLIEQSKEAALGLTGAILEASNPRQIENKTD